MPRERATANRGTILTTTMRSAGWHVGAAHVADSTLEEERRHWLSLGGGGSLFSTRVRCRPFTQPSYHPASTRIVLFDACSGVAVSVPWKRLLSAPARNEWLAASTYRGRLGPGGNESPCSFSSADLFEPSKNGTNFSAPGCVLGDR